MEHLTNISIKFSPTVRAYISPELSPKVQTIVQYQTMSEKGPRLGDARKELAPLGERTTTSPMRSI